MQICHCEKKPGESSLFFSISARVHAYCHGEFSTIRQNLCVQAILQDFGRNVERCYCLGCSSSSFRGAATRTKVARESFQAVAIIAPLLVRWRTNWSFGRQFAARIREQCRGLFWTDTILLSLSHRYLVIIYFYWPHLTMTAYSIRPEGKPSEYVIV